MTLLGRGKERATAMAKITGTTEADPYGMTNKRTSKKDKDTSTNGDGGDA
jgi:hypothetical protein